MSDDDTQRGLYQKFQVQHVKEKVQGDDLFVLDVDHDPASLAAMRAWYHDHEDDEPYDYPHQSFYHVTRTDGSLKHRHCLYHVLNFSQQYNRSLRALKVYHQQIKGTHPVLAADLWGKYLQPAEEGC